MQIDGKIGQKLMKIQIEVIVKVAISEMQNSEGEASQVS